MKSFAREREIILINTIWTLLASLRISLVCALKELLLLGTREIMLLIHGRRGVVPGEDSRLKLQYL